jgi:hypothetical protein
MALIWPITFIFIDIYLEKFIFHINNIGQIESDFTIILTCIVRNNTCQNSSLSMRVAAAERQTSGKYGQRECGAPECPKQKSGNTMQAGTYRNVGL